MSSLNSPARARYRAETAAALAVLAGFLVVRVGLAPRHGLWADELFSLAIATGHSLEHPAAQADAARGDFIEVPAPVSPAVYSRYLEDDAPGLEIGRVLRAVLLSDTNPPLYYLLLDVWIAAFGGSDVALRSLSVVWSLACLPVLWALAGRAGGPAARLPTLVLFAVAPMSVYYATEGRMYSQLWFFTSAAAWLTLRLHDEGGGRARVAAWGLVAGGGLLTHYFFAPVLAACVSWLLLRPGRCPRRSVIAGAALAALVALPWYIHLPASLSYWRVTGGWLEMRPRDYNGFMAALSLPWRFFSLRVEWGRPVVWDWLNGIGYACLALLAARLPTRQLLAAPRQLFGLWLAAGWATPVALDLVLGTYSCAVPRYAFAGMPAAFLLAGVVLGDVRPLARAALVVLLGFTGLVGDRRLYRSEARHDEPFREIGARLARGAGPSDVVVVHSIPSGVCGIARYLAASAREPPPMASWVGQLGRRNVPEDLRRLAAGRRRMILVKIHEVGEPAPEEDWLRDHATLTAQERFGSATLLYFEPRQGNAFVAAEAPREPGRQGISYATQDDRRTTAHEPRRRSP